jgi:hypothetical protein
MNDTFFLHLHDEVRHSVALSISDATNAKIAHTMCVTTFITFDAMPPGVEPAKRSLVQARSSAELPPFVRKCTVLIMTKTFAERFAPARLRQIRPRPQLVHRMREGAARSTPRVLVTEIRLVEQSRDSGDLGRHCRGASEILEPKRHSKHQSKGAPAAYALHAHVFTASSQCCGVQSRPLSPRSQKSPSALELA